MTVKYEGNGVTITRTGITSKVKRIEFGGKKRNSIDVTDITASVKQFVGEAQWKFEPIKITLEYDPSVYRSIDTSNLSTVLTIGSNTITVWAEIIEVGALVFEAGSQPTYDIVLEITNRNGSGAETVPVFSA